MGAALAGDYNDQTALHLCARPPSASPAVDGAGPLDMARILLAHGADPRKPDRFGECAADYAARHGLSQLTALMAER